MSDEKQLKKELGFKVKEIYTEKNRLVVEVEEPEPTLSTRVFTFGPDMTETKKFVRDGEGIEEPRWKLRHEDKLEREYDEEVEVPEEAEKLKGERISVE